MASTNRYTTEAFVDSVLWFKYVNFIYSHENITLGVVPNFGNRQTREQNTRTRARLAGHGRDLEDMRETRRTRARLGRHARQGSTENSNYSVQLVERVPSKLRITRVFRHSLTVFWPKLEATRNLQEDVHSEMIDRIAIGRNFEH